MDTQGSLSLRHRFESVHNSSFSYPSLLVRELGAVVSILRSIDYFTILVYCPPQILLLTLNLYIYLIKEERVSISLMPAPQLSGIFRAKLNAP
jgi:hypothetical protein